MRTYRRYLSPLLGWPLIVAVVVASVSISIYFDELRYKRVIGEDEIERLLAGHTLKGQTFRFYYGADSRMVGHVDRFFDQGTWTVSTSGYCEHWQNWGEGEPRCWATEFDGTHVRRQPLQQLTVIDEREKVVLERVRGNRIEYFSPTTPSR